MHPLRQANAALVVAEILEHVGTTVDMKPIGDGRRILKYKDARSIKGADRLARGLILNDENQPVNLPMPKFDEAAPFHPKMSVYHDSLRSKLTSDKIQVQPKHDGTSIIAVCRQGQLIVSTFLSCDNAQATKARELLGDVRWTEGLTLQMELIWKDDPKVQSRRVADGLYLFYGCYDDGRELTRKELHELSERLPVMSLVKEQKMSPSKVMALVEHIDGACTRAELQEGIVAVINGRRVKVKSWQYLHACGKPFVNSEWLNKQIKASKTLEDLHSACENHIGVLDDNLVARQLLAERLTAVREWMDEIARYDCKSVDAIKEAPKQMQAVLFKRHKLPDFWNEDEGLLSVIKGFR